MLPLHDAPEDVFASVDVVLTDMDETLTTEGRLFARTYDALERLRADGVRVVPVTAAPAGWCDQMARMWPVDGVIGENGGFFFSRTSLRILERHFWHEGPAREAADARLASAREIIDRTLPRARLATDQPFRQTSLAYARPQDAATTRDLRAALAAAGLSTTLNDLWVLGWVGGYDKRSAARHHLGRAWGLDLDGALDRVAYSGDSANDAPMFAALRHTVGVASIRDHLADIPVPPRWITRDPGGDGFVEFADKILAGRALRTRSEPVGSP